MAVIYFLIGLGATIFGSMAGLGGGIIIKPVLDLFGDYDVESIAVLSASTVLAMACVSLFNQTKGSVKINVRSSLPIAVGSVFGGIFGKFSFTYVLSFLEKTSIVTVIQSSIIAILMCLIFIFVKYKDRIKTYELNNVLLIVAIGFLLGVLAAFLGIGGGPLNVAILVLCFSMGAKESALNSIFIIFFSQLSALILTAFTGGFSGLELTMLIYMVPGGVIGGYIGSRISKFVTDRIVDNIFAVGIVLIIFISIWNIVTSFV